jgi:ABC-type nitrate/sulfonate/bicarbonate transport system permease component
MRSERLLRAIFGALPIAGLTLLWWYATARHLVSPIILPSPADVREAVVDIYTGYLGVPAMNHFVASLSVMLSGYLAAVVIGVPGGIAMAWFPALDRLFGPLIAVLRPIPPPAWIPLAILWFGIGLGGKAFIVFIAAVVPCIFNGYLAVKETPPGLIAAARSLGASQRTLLAEVVLPSGLPVILTGMRIALGTAWATIVAAELVVSLAGFGFLIMNGYRNLESNIVLVGMIAVAVIGFLMNALFLIAEKYLLPWREADA